MHGNMKDKSNKILLQVYIHVDGNESSARTRKQFSFSVRITDL